jgi:regulatory protein
MEHIKTWKMLVNIEKTDMKPLKSKAKKDEVALFQYGIRLLGLREWSRSGMEKKMRENSDSKADIENALDKLEEYGYLDDRRYTEIYVRSCKEYRGYGPIKTRFKLKEKGISDKLITEFLDEKGDDWHLKAYDARFRKFGADACSAEEKAKQINFLMRRGFNYDHVKSAFEKRESAEES